MSRVIVQQYKYILSKKRDAVKYLKLYILPMNGIVSHGILGANLMAPNLVSLGMHRSNVSTLFLTSTFLSTSVYLFDRPSIAKLPMATRGGYAVYGAALYSMGSMLTWGILKSTLPLNESWFGVAASLVAGGVLTKVLYDFINHCDSLQIYENKKRFAKDKKKKRRRQNEVIVIADQNEAHVVIANVNEQLARDATAIDD